MKYEGSAPPIKGDFTNPEKAQAAGYVEPKVAGRDNSEYAGSSTLLVMRLSLFIHSCSGMVLVPPGVSDMCLMSSFEAINVPRFRG